MPMTVHGIRTRPLTDLGRHLSPNLPLIRIIILPMRLTHPIRRRRMLPITVIQVIITRHPPVFTVEGPLEVSTATGTLHLHRPILTTTGTTTTSRHIILPSPRTRPIHTTATPPAATTIRTRHITITTAQGPMKMKRSIMKVPTLSLREIGTERRPPRGLCFQRRHRKSTLM